MSDQKPQSSYATGRYYVRIAIYYGPHQENVLSNYTVNMSTGGVFIETVRILPEDTQLTIEFSLPDSTTIIATHARVAWINDPLAPKKPALPPGMGVQFLDLSLENMHIIRDFLELGHFRPTW